MSTKTQQLILLFLAAITSCKPTKVGYNPFDKLDLSKKCAVYFIQFVGDKGDFEKANKDFIITDKTTIKNLKENWGLKLTDKRMGCGWSYNVFITQNDTLLERIKINAPCEYAITTGGWYDFNKDYYKYIDVSKISKISKPTADSIFIYLKEQLKD